MAVAPQTSTVTVTVHPGQLLGLTLCQVSNHVQGIVPGLIDDLNHRCPGTIEVGDRIMKVNGEEGKAFLLIRAFAGSLTDGPKRLDLTMLRPVEFDVAIDVSAAGKELGLEIVDVGFVQRIAHGGMIEAHNIAQEAKGLPCLREGDRVIEVSGRAPATEDGAAGNVLPYLCLAMCGGASPLHLRVRRGDYALRVNHKRVALLATTTISKAFRRARCVSTALTTGATPLRRFRASSAGSALRYLLCRPRSRSDLHVVAKRCSRKVDLSAGVDIKRRADSKQSTELSCDDPQTESTRGLSSCPSWSEADPDAERADFPAGFLRLPGVIQRSP
jgi:hypothetical protein